MSRMFEGVMQSTVTPLNEDFTPDLEITRVLAKPEVNEQFFDSGVEVFGSTPEEFGVRVKADTERWRKLIKEAGINRPD